MNVSSLKNYIIENPEFIEVILEKAGFHHISDKFSGGSEYRCAWDEDSNPTSIRIYKSNLTSKNFKTGLEGDIITLIQDKKQYSFPKTLDYISKIVNFEDDGDVEYDLAFSGLFLELEQIQETGEYINLTTFKESVLDDYLIMPSIRFVDDGIDFNTQKYFQIGYDHFSNRIIVPWRSLKGEVIGIMGRLNKSDEEIQQYENKWFPIIPFPKSKTLFGYSHNYKHIQESKSVMLFESEKSVMKCKSQGNNIALALGGSSLSNYQSDNINSLFPESIFIGLDEGISEDQSVELAEKLKYDTYYHNNVYYIYDKNNIYLPKGSKMSPADLPMQDLKGMMKSCIKKV